MIIKIIFSSGIAAVIGLVVYGIWDMGDTEWSDWVIMGGLLLIGTMTIIMIMEG